MGWAESMGVCRKGICTAVRLNMERKSRQLLGATLVTSDMVECQHEGKGLNGVKNLKKNIEFRRCSRGRGAEWFKEYVAIVLI